MSRFVKKLLVEIFSAINISNKGMQYINIAYKKVEILFKFDIIPHGNRYTSTIYANKHIFVALDSTTNS